jgi:hypothetical protein
VRSATGMTDKRCEADKACGLRGGRELHTIEVANQASTGRSSMGDWTGEVPANCSFCCNGSAFTSLAGTRLLACAWNALGNLGGEPNWITRPRLIGAGSDKGAWWWPKEAAMKSWRRDLQKSVSLLFLGAGEQDDYFYPRGILHREDAGRSWAVKNTSNISGVE